MTNIPPVACARLAPGDFLGGVRPNRVLYFLVNVGDGDCQLIVMPANSRGDRRCIVVDVANERKLSRLLGELTRVGIVSDSEGRLPLVVATHPHEDHIRGMASFVALNNTDIGEFWEPGYLAARGSFHRMMVALEDHLIPLRRPTSGHVSVVDNVRVTVLTPSVRLRNQFVTHDVNENNTSLALRLDFPAASVLQLNGARRRVEPRQTCAILLGADAQAESWAHALVDFPRLNLDGRARARAIRSNADQDVLQAQVFKVPHHASKHGVHLELVERVGAAISVVSCVNGGGRHDFPHELARSALRDAKGHSLNSPASDDELGIQYTGAVDTNGADLGTICLELSPRRGLVWRFGDRPDEDVDLTAARLWR